MDIKHIFSAIAVTFMGVAYCELPPVPEGVEVYDGEREGISYEDEVAAGRTPTPTDYKAADKLLLQMNPDAFTSDGREYLRLKKPEGAIKPTAVKWDRVMPWR